MTKIPFFDLKGFRKANEISQLALANILGVTQGFVSKMESGDTPIPETVMDALYNMEWKVPADVFAIAKMHEQQDGYRHEMTRGIPLLPLEAIAGPGTPAYSDEQVQDYYEVTEFRDSDFLIRVKGDSMIPRYTGGDLVACKTVNDVLYYQYGRVYVLNTKSQGVMIKRVQPSGKEDCILCVSDNAKYAPFEVPKEDITAVALVMGSISLE